jgi:hypothetical protein
MMVVLDGARGLTVQNGRFFVMVHQKPLKSPAFRHGCC